MEKAKNIGMKTEAPKGACTDKKCPYHGNVQIRGRIFQGLVTNAKVARSVSVEWDRLKFLPKYERYEKKKTRIHAHNPPCIDAKAGDKVTIAECRPLSKTKNFVIVEKL